MAKGSNSAKPKRRSARTDRLLKKIGPQIVENTKKVLVMKGHKTSQEIIDVLKDFSLLSKPECKVFSRKNEILPFEDQTSFEYLGEKNDCSLIALGSHTKKRPNNLVLARTFDGHLLDMFEFGVECILSIEQVGGRKKVVYVYLMFVYAFKNTYYNRSVPRIETNDNFSRRSMGYRLIVYKNPKFSARLLQRYGGTHSI